MDETGYLKLTVHTAQFKDPLFLANVDTSVAVDAIICYNESALIQRSLCSSSKINSPVVG